MQFPCLSPWSPDLTASTISTDLTQLTARIRLVDQDGAAGGSRGAVVHGRWLRPDGSSFDQYATIDTQLRADFRLDASDTGWYRFTIVNVGKSGYVFHAPAPNLLTASIEMAASANSLPVAVANADRTSREATSTITFTASGSSDSDGNIVAYHWAFGDGTTADTAEASHSYLNPGSYRCRIDRHR